METTRVTPNQLIRVWSSKVHTLQLNAWNFEVKAGNIAKDVFRESFDLKEFNSKKQGNTSPWPKRSKRSKGKHPLMVQTGSLKKSIKWRRLGEKNDKNRGVVIYTDPNGFNRTKSHRGFCYAAVHNAPDSAGTRRGAVKNMPQRQFMGHSDVLKAELEKLSSIIFKGFPT